jgi:hypothetical protein
MVVHLVWTRNGGAWIRAGSLARLYGHLGASLVLSALRSSFLFLILSSSFR